jgi:hypothetical protein
MLSSDSLRARLPALSRPRAALACAGSREVMPAVSVDRPLVRYVGGRVEVDRLTWCPESPSAPGPGRIASRPCAVGVSSQIYAASTAAGAPAWVRAARTDRFGAAASAIDHRSAAAFGRSTGIRVPGLLAIEAGRVWLDRIDWQPDAVPRSDVVDRFIESAITTPLVAGTVVALGPPHVDDGGYLVVEDCGVLALLEPDQTALLAALLLGLADRDSEAVALVVQRLTGVPGVLLIETARRACAALAVGWTPAAFGLSVHQLASRSSHLGSRAHAFALFADELLHRLDLWHEHRYGTKALVDPVAVRRLVSTTGHLP